MRHAFEHRIAPATVIALWAWSLMPGQALAGEILGRVVDRTGAAVPDAVIVASPPEGPATRPQPAAGPPLVMDQIDKEFVPYVLPVPVGASVSFPNRDDIRHHVYSFSPARRFELPLYSGTPATPVTFDKPGVVVLGCNIHDWMVAYIYVSKSLHFGKTAADGTTSLDGLAGGDYVVRVWHPRLSDSEEATAKRVEVPGEGRVEVSFEIGLKPEFRIPRAPIPGQGGYR